MNANRILLAFSTVLAAHIACAKVLVYEGFHTSDYGLTSSSGPGIGGQYVPGNYTIGVKTDSPWYCSGNANDIKVVGYNYGLSLPSVMSKLGFSVVGASLETNHDNDSAKLSSAYHELVDGTFNVSSGKLYLRMLVRANTAFVGKLVPNPDFESKDGAYAGFGFCKAAQSNDYLLSTSTPSFFFAISKDANEALVLSLVVVDASGGKHIYTLDSSAGTSDVYICYAEISVNAGANGAEIIRAGSKKCGDFTSVAELDWNALSGSDTSVEVDFMTNETYPDAMAMTGPSGTKTNGSAGFFRADEIVLSTTLGEILNFAVEPSGTPTIGQNAFSTSWKLIAQSGVTASASIVFGTNESLAGATTNLLGTGFSAGTRTAALSGLTPLTTYWWKIVASNENETIESRVSSFRTLYRANMYVALGNAGAAEPYDTLATAAPNIATALSIADDGSTIHVSPGRYTVTTPVAVNRAVRILGDDPDPSRVVVSNKTNAGSNNGNHRVFTLNHADAFVANLTMQNGLSWGTSGSSFLIDSNGGTVSNCVVEAGMTKGNGAMAAGGWLNAGLVSHTVFRRCTVGSDTTSDKNQDYRPAVLWLKGASRAENCLLVNNTQAANKALSLVRLDGTSTMRNCTIVSSGLGTTNQYCKLFAPIYIDSANITVQNVVVAGVTNRIDGGLCRPVGTVSRFFNGAVDADISDLPFPEGTVVGTAAQFFNDYANGDYTLNPTSLLVNAGINYDGMASVDLSGNRRKVGKLIDIGCYECQKENGIFIIVR